MYELYQESIRLINFPLTIMVVLVVVYWLFVILGFLDIDLLDFDLDIDVDGAEPGFLGKLANFCHFGDAPFFVILSILMTLMWMFSVMMNYYFNPEDALWLGLLFLIPNFVASILITGVVVIPVHHFYKQLNHDGEVRKTVVGEICQATTRRVDSKSGQAEVLTEAAPVVVNARTSNEKEFLNKGEKGVIVRMNDDGTYIIKKLEE